MDRECIYNRKLWHQKLLKEELESEKDFYLGLSFVKRNTTSEKLFIFFMKIYVSLESFPL